jgi:hypothetical protein
MLLEPFGGPGRRLPAQPGSSNKWVARGTISSRQIDDLEPALTRHGYDVRTRADRFNVKPIEIKALLAGNPARRAYPRADRSHERRWGPRMDRMAAQSAKIEAGHVYLPKSAAWPGEFLTELLSFPNGRHDDQVDSVSQFLRWLQDAYLNQISFHVPFVVSRPREFLP